ncbi:XRE family transcriptional regulator [Leptotrichia trevisanii]
MNKKLLKSKMSLYGDNNKSLAKKLEITQSAMSYKINGNNKFNPKEMIYIKSEYKLSDEEFFNIFFENSSTER